MEKQEFLIDFDDFEYRCSKLANIIKANKNIKDIYGIARGGLIPAVRLSYLTGLPLTSNPKLNQTAIIEDVQDTGMTRHSFSHFNHFFPLIDKQDEAHLRECWVVFWYEK